MLVVVLLAAGLVVALNWALCGGLSQGQAPLVLLDILADQGNALCQRIARAALLQNDIDL